jgi:CoA:oxalate CoA-transferase
VYSTNIKFNIIKRNILIDSNRRILSGIQVLDFTHVVAGPYATRILADLGAEIIKIDLPINPDDPYPVLSSGRPGYNVGKKSISVDLKTKDGKGIAQKISQSSDILIENFSPGTMKKLGMDFEKISESNPRLIIASISGFGQTGKDSSRRAFGATAHAEAGWLWTQQQAASTTEPFAPGVTVADILTAMDCISGILAALFDRERTGKGQQIDISLMDSQLAMLSEVANRTLLENSSADHKPFRHPIHQTKDGFININIGPGIRNWARIAAAFDNPSEQMPDMQDERNAKVAHWVSKFTNKEVAERMDKNGAPFGIVKTLHDALKNPVFHERGMIAQITNEYSEKIPVIGSPMHFSNAISGPEGIIPIAGEHTRNVLSANGYDGDLINSLIESKIVFEQIRN